MKFNRNKLCFAVSTAVLSMSLAACGSSGGGDNGKVTDPWVDSNNPVVGNDSSLVYVPVETKDTCVIPQNTLIVKGDFYDEYAAWMWTGEGENSVNLIPGSDWPGEEFTSNFKGSDCAAPIHFYNHEENGSLVSLENYQTIVNNNKVQGLQTGDGNFFTQDRPCLSMTSASNATFVTAAECGVIIDGLDEQVPMDNAAYISYDGSIREDGAEIEFTEKVGKPETAYIDVTLLFKGPEMAEDAKGLFWFSKASAKTPGDSRENAIEFTNGDIIRVGQDLVVPDGDTKSVKLNVMYNGAVSSYTIRKSYVVKTDECRLNTKTEPLGAEYTSSGTTFRIWSPNSSSVSVTVDGTKYDMSKADISCLTDVYEVFVDGDLAGKTYQFSIGGKDVRDPYGKMVANGSDTANIVMDMSQTEPDEAWVDAPELKNREDSVIYEVHVRDFTIDETSGVVDGKRGRYLGMVQTGTTYNGVTTGIDHLKELGVTHVQLQPIYDYATCSNVDSQSNDCYNWGYDPWNYNVPEDRYSSRFGTDDYNTKIREVKTMVNEFHKNGIRVIMDVVYNHTMNKSVFENITSKYYLKADLTGCGNTVNADNNMVWTMIRDSMDYWINEYHIDGFRLDLVGSFSMKDYSDWGVYLNKMHPDANLLIYGEPWAADVNTAEELVDNPVRTGRMHMQADDAHVGAFNNRIRNCLKGSSDNADALGFIFNEFNSGWDGNGTNEKDEPLNSNLKCVFMGAIGGVRHKDATGTDIWSAQGFTDPEQSISYLTAHDNLALRDKIEAAGVTALADKKKLQVYANAMIFASQGISFIHGGEEIGRTKAAAGNDIHNSYNTTTGANDYKWNLKSGDWKDVSEAYAKLIALRKAHPAFHMTTADDIFDNVTLDTANSNNEIVVFDINGAAVGDEWSSIKVAFNSKETAVTVSNLDAQLVKVVDGYNVLEGVVNNDVAEPQSVTIWAVLPQD